MNFRRYNLGMGCSNMNRLSKLALLLLAVVLLLACFTDTASACPTCKDGMAGDPAYSNMVHGYFWSILFMMSMPFLVFSGVASYFYYEVCRARRQQAAVSTVAVSSVAPNTSVSPEIALQS